MVLQKRLDYGSRGHQIPAMPHVPKSARGKRSARKKVEDKLMCAFDLLATVAGSLLLEGDNSGCQKDIGTSDLSTTKEAIKQEEQVDYEKISNSESIDQQSSIESVPGPRVGPQIADGLKDDSFVCTATTGFDSGSVKSEEAVHAVIAAESIAISNKGEVGCHITTDHKICDALNITPSSEESREFKGGDNSPLQAEYQIVSNLLDENTPKLVSSQDQMDLDTKPPLASLDHSHEVPLCGNNNHPGSFPKPDDEMKLSVYKDDDENSSGCTDSSIPNNKVSRPQRFGDRRIRKLRASKYWKVSSHLKQNDQFCNYESKPALHNKKMCYTRQRTQRSSFKRRKLVDRHSGLAKFCKKRGLNFEGNNLQENIHGANGTSSSISGNKSQPFDSSDYHVKLKINSFKVPEIYIDIPETATVGSLKQTVVEAITAILGGGLRVGVLLQGKKVRDENKTLSQAGISHENELDSVGFMLEPNPSNTPPLTSSEDPNSHGITDDAEPLARMPPVTPAAVDQGGSVSTPQPVLSSCNESDHDSVQSPADGSLLYKAESESRALVAVPSLDAETLDVVPLRKTRRAEVAQRRIRRPFSVTEVEALVQAVEKLGTGRWRDVKLRAFENAKHRTYVDLKDKWKTLVHTAKISPQQRRGEPVPQEVLDRVLAAHAYWSHQQAKLQIKPHEEPLSALV